MGSDTKPERQPAELFPVGEFIRDEMMARHWTVVDLAGRMGRSVLFVEQLINGEHEVTRGISEDLGKALGSEPDTWRILDIGYRRWRARRDLQVQEVPE